MVIIKSENQLKMKKVTRILGLCALVALATVSCKKDDNNVPQGGKSFRATINQPTDGAKTHIGDGNYLMWNSGDEIKVYTADGTSAVFTTTDADVYEDAVFTGDIKEADKYVAFYPADNASDAQEGNVILTLPDQQTYEANNFANDAYPMAAYWEGNAGDDVDFQFHSPCAVVCLPLKGNAKVTSIDLTGKNYLTDILAGTLKVDINNFDPANPSAGGYTPVSAKWTVSLSCGNDGVQLYPNTATNFYFVVAAPHEIFKSGLKFVVNYEGGSETLETTKDNGLIAETILTMPEKEVNKPTPPIGDFTVGFGGADDHIRKVTFAPGNLWYNKNDQTWHMENNQWDYHTYTTSANAIGLFCWSNELSNYGIVFEEDRTFVEWGNLVIYKPNSNTETYAANEWRTLTDFEQAVLLNYRERSPFYTETCGKKLHRSMEVNGVRCMVVAPDNYEGNIDNATWAELEAVGAFAMPMAGGYSDYDDEPFMEGDEFSWWSSSVNGNSDGYSARHVYYQWETSDDDTEGCVYLNASMYHRFSVRLVKNTIGWE